MKKRQRIAIPDRPAGLGVTRARNSRGDWYIKVRCGKRFTHGQVITRQFRTEKAAREFIFGTGPNTASEFKAIIPGVLNLKKAGGASGFLLTPSQHSEAAAAVDALGATPLMDAVKFYLNHARPDGGVKLLSEVIKAHVAAKRERLGLAEEEKSTYVRAQEISCAVLREELRDPPIIKISRAQIEDIPRRRRWQPLNKRNYYRDWSMLFKFAIEQGFLTRSPLHGVKRPRVFRVTPLIYTIEEAAKLLATANEHFPEMLPYVAIGLFAGPRLEEMKRMDWTMVESDFISLSVEVTKTNEARLIPIERVLQRWLKFCREEMGPILPAVGLRGLMERLYKTAGFRKRNALRHSFGSYHLALTSSPEKTQLALGQQTPSVLFKSYRQVVRPAQAKQYFNLTPDVVAKMFPPGL